MKETIILRKLIERESKFASYKFALLRGIIEVIGEYDHLKIENEDDTISFPLGLLIEKWMLYYYPLIENNIPQIYGKRDITFRKELEDFINEYKHKGGFLQFYSDYRHSKLNREKAINLFRKIKTAIHSGSMKYLGHTSNRKYYSIFKYEGASKRKRAVNDIREYLINNFGYIRFDKNLYILLREFGSFINGTESIIFKWALFSVNINKSLNQEEVISLLLKNTEIERDVSDAKKVYDRNIKKLECVWTGKKLTRGDYDVDHALPFSITYINDLWNLLPSHSKVNNQKRDKIPVPELIEKRQNQIKFCWRLLLKNYNGRFIKEIEIGLTGNQTLDFEEGINKFKEKSRFLIERGYEPWSP